MPIADTADIEITGFEWVPPFAVGLVRDLRPRWACEEAGLPYRERLISAVDRPQWYFTEQPWGQVPVLRDGDLLVFESGATLLYLAEQTGQLLPGGGQARADALGWFMAAFNSVEPLLLQLADASVFSAREEWAPLRLPSLKKAIAKRIEPVARHVAEREWLAGEFSIADIAMVTVLRQLGTGPLLDAQSAIAAYLARAQERPAFQRALEDQLRPYAVNAPKTAGE